MLTNSLSPSVFKHVTERVTTPQKSNFKNHDTCVNIVAKNSAMKV